MITTKIGRDFTYRLEDLITNFNYYIEYFNNNVPFKNDQFETHAETIRLRGKHDRAIKAIENREYVQSLYKTLIAWRIGSRGSKLLGFPDFHEAILSCRDSIDEIEQWTLDSFEDGDSGSIFSLSWNLIDGLKIVNNEAKLVPCTKALHHILPQLFVPIDRKYTQAFFMLYNPQFQYEQRKRFNFMFRTFIKINRYVKPSKYVGKNWHTSPTKVIDNAIIGFCNAKGYSGEKFK